MKEILQKSLRGWGFDTVSGYNVSKYCLIKGSAMNYC